MQQQNEGLTCRVSAGMKGFHRVMLGRGSMYADVCCQQGFIGAHFGIDQDLTGFLGDDPSEFNQQVRPIYLSVFP